MTSKHILRSFFFIFVAIILLLFLYQADQSRATVVYFWAEWAFYPGDPVRGRFPGGWVLFLGSHWRCLWGDLFHRPSSVDFQVELVLHGEHPTCMFLRH